MMLMLVSHLFSMCEISNFVYVKKTMHVFVVSSQVASSQHWVWMGPEYSNTLSIAVKFLFVNFNLYFVHPVEAQVSYWTKRREFGRWKRRTTKGWRERKQQGMGEGWGYLHTFIRILRVVLPSWILSHHVTKPRYLLPNL